MATPCSVRRRLSQEGCTRVREIADFLRHTISFALEGCPVDLVERRTDDGEIHFECEHEDLCLLIRLDLRGPSRISSFDDIPDRL